MVVRTLAIDTMYSYLDIKHAENINENAFNDISNVLLDFEDTHLKEESVKWVCNASMGHGKTTVLKCWLKKLIDTANKTHNIHCVPVLVAVRENEMGEEIFHALNEYKNGSAVYVNSDNKTEVEEIVAQTQVVIISHSRLENLALGYGDSYLYSTWSNENEPRRKRLLIIDEKPTFVNDFNIDIGKNNNALEWFDKLASKLEVDECEVQAYRSYIISLVSNQLISDDTVTTSLIPKDEQKSERATRLLLILKEMEELKENKQEITMMHHLKIFKKLLLKDGIGRIDAYSINGIKGKKLMTAEKINYEKLSMNVLILDGTANITRYQYGLCDYELKHVHNYNNYSRLTFHIESLKTSSSSRSNKKQHVQRAITERVRELKKSFSGLIVLPSKNDQQIYRELKVIDETDDLHLLNTVGKNPLKDKMALYLTSLPRRNPDYYKSIAIGLIDSKDNKVDISMNDEENVNWFKDIRLETIYTGELMAELLQIIHRTKLRVIGSNDPIDVFVAYDDEEVKGNGERWSISNQLNRDYFDKKAKIITKKIHNGFLYGRNEKIEKFATEIREELLKNNYSQGAEIRLSDIGKIGTHFREWLKRNWKGKEGMINSVFEQCDLTLIEKKDGYSEKSKYIKIS